MKPSLVLRAGRLLAACALPVVLAWAPASHAQKLEKPDVRIVLGWTFVASQAMFTYGVDKGFFKAEGLNVTVDRGAGSGTAIQRVNSGAYDFGYADVGTLTKYNAENRARPLQALYIVEDDSPLALFTLEGKGISKPKDVEGKRIAVSQFDGARQMFPVLAKANKIDAGSMTWKTVDPQLREMMLARGEADVITGFTTTSIPLLTTLKQKFVVLRYPDFGVQGMGQALVTSPDFTEKYPNTARAVVRALNRSVKAMIEDPKGAVESLKSRDATVDLEAENFRMDLMVKQLILTAHAKKNGLSNPDPQRLAGIIASVLEVSDVKDALPVSVVYNDRFLPPVAERIPPEYKR
jgi:NitT/TauT family transport system substrate-binding protein